MSPLELRYQLWQSMRAALPEAEARVHLFYIMQEYQLGWRDEELQPTELDFRELLLSRLCLLACEAVGGNIQSALPLAAGLQILDEFLLVHRDIEDQQLMCRGRPTMWKQWGVAQGINVGDGMFFIAHQALHRLHQLGVSAETQLRVSQRFDQLLLMALEGQFLALSYQDDPTVTQADYLAMIGRKTGLIIAASELGAILGGGDTGTVTALSEFGQNLGIALQIQADIQGIWGDANTASPGELSQRPLSLPIIYALHATDDPEPLAELYSQGVRDDPAVRRALESSRAREHTTDMAAQYCQKALRVLDTIHGHAPALNALRAIVQEVLDQHNA